MQRLATRRSPWSPIVARPTTATSAAARRAPGNVHAAARPALPGHCASRTAAHAGGPRRASGAPPSPGAAPAMRAAAGEEARRGRARPTARLSRRQATLADASRAFAPTGSRASRTRGGPRAGTTRRTRRSSSGTSNAGMVMSAASPTVTSIAPSTARGPTGAVRRTVSRRARRRSRAGRILDPRGLGASRSQRSCPAGASSSRTRWPASADPAM